MARDLSREAIRIGTLAGKGARTPEYVRALLAHGFESFQLNFGQSLEGVDLRELAVQMKEVLGDSGTLVSCLGIYGNPLGEAPEHAESRRAWEEAIDSAEAFGTNLVCGFTGRVPDVPIPESMPRFAEVFRDLARRAADRGVRIAFENCPMGGDWQRGDWNLAHSPAAWELLFNAVDGDNIGLEWEPCHQMCQLIDPMPQLRKWVGRIFHVHGKDANIHDEVLREHGAYGEQRFAWHRHPGFGDCNWAHIISDLRAGGYRGSIDIEGWHDPVYRDELEITGQVHALHYLRRCRGGDGYFVPNPEGF